MLKARLVSTNKIIHVHVNYMYKDYFGDAVRDLIIDKIKDWRVGKSYKTAHCTRVTKLRSFGQSCPIN